jgi:TetR/AcrR family transcriptional regulator, tetracycline repressor protein
LSTVTRKQAAAPARERLSRERIVDHALALTDAEGLDAVTIRRLAQDQGVTPMAMYWHFKDKDRLLDGIAERLMSEVVLPPDGSDAGRWDDQFRDLLAAVLVVLRAHPAAADLLHTRIMLSEAGLNVTERALGLLRQAGFSPEQSAQVASQALASIVLLVTAEPGKPDGLDTAGQEQRLRTKRAALQALPPDRYPNVLASVDGFVACASEAYFELGLELFIAGVRGIQPAP